MRVAIEDFGSGYASVKHLRRLPVVDNLKLDREVVQGAAQCQTDTDICRITALAIALTLSVVAEGIEDPDIASRFAERGCASGRITTTPPRPTPRTPSTTCCSHRP